MKLEQALKELWKKGKSLYAPVYITLIVENGSELLIGIRQKYGKCPQYWRQEVSSLC